MKELQRTQHQDELNEIINQKKKLKEAYNAQLKHLEDREKKLNTELKVLKSSNKKV